MAALYQSSLVKDAVPPFSMTARVPTGQAVKTCDKVQPCIDV